jgi:hypothetical protein
MAIPAKYQRWGLQWWRSQIVEYIVQLNPGMQAELADAWSAVSHDDPSFQCTAVHIRRGDKIREDKTQADVATFIDAAKEMGFANILVARCCLCSGCC